jgi:hypothetical protein
MLYDDTDKDAGEAQRSALVTTERSSSSNRARIFAEVRETAWCIAHSVPKKIVG